MTMIYFIFCLIAAVTYAVKFDLDEKTPENNPDLNRRDLGALQQAWKTIERASNETNYLMYSSLDHYFYKYRKCIQIRTSNLNETRMTANYTMEWYKYHYRNSSLDQAELLRGEVQALKQRGYSTENVLRVFYPDDRRRVPHTTVGSPNGSYLLAKYSNYDCDQGIYDPWYLDHDEAYYESYVVFSQPMCYVLRTVERRGVHVVRSASKLDFFFCAACELWATESWLNSTLKGKKRKGTSEENTERIPTEREDSAEESAEESTGTSFTKLPRHCRLAFLLNCGYPTMLVYNKTDCDKINKTQVVASGEGS
ncbi:unnamed protein product [Ixodes hexagonus]